MKRLFAVSILAAAVCAAPASAAAPLQTRKAAERNVLKLMLAAALQTPATPHSTGAPRVVCVGLGRHVGRRYRRFQCTIWPWNGRTLTLVYPAKAGRGPGQRTEIGIDQAGDTGAFRGSHRTPSVRIQTG